MKSFGHAILTLLKMVLLAFGALLVAGGGLCGAGVAGVAIAKGVSIGDFFVLLLYLGLSAIPITLGIRLVACMRRSLKGPPQP